MTLVNITCANGDMMPRTKNVTDVCSTPPSRKLIAKYWMFSVKAKPAPMSAPYTMPSTGPSIARRAVAIDDQEAESLGDLLDDGRLHHRAEHLRRVGVGIAEDERQAEIDQQRDRHRADGAPGEREHHQPSRLGLPAIDEPDREEDAGERDEREDRAEERGAGADELEEVADEGDEQQDEDAADPDGRAASRPARRRGLQRHRRDGVEVTGAGGVRLGGCASGEANPPAPPAGFWSYWSGPGRVMHTA